MKSVWRCKAQIRNISTFIEKLLNSYCFCVDNVTTTIGRPSSATYATSAVHEASLTVALADWSSGGQFDSVQIHLTHIVDV
jgi:hypothetical protein